MSGPRKRKKRHGGINFPVPGSRDPHTKKQRMEDTKEYLILGQLALVVGVIGGFAAIVFRYLIALMHNMFFLGRVSFTYDSYQYISTSTGWLVFIVPAIGGIFVGLLVKYGAHEAKGHGVPEVMEAVVKEGGRIRPRVGVIKALASAVTIGSGGSAGREGPIIAIGASGGSTLGQFLHLSDEKTRILVACGASAGIAATFNAPIAGVVFSLELILLEFKTRSFVPLVISSVSATVIFHVFMGVQVAFPIREMGEIYSMKSTMELPLYLLLGVIAGLAGLFFNKFFYGLEDVFDRIRMPEHIKTVLGGLLLGFVALALYLKFGHYYVLGVGYGSMMPILQSDAGGIMLTSIGLIVFLLLLLLAKMVATSLTLGSGASGGIFAPSLWMGAMLGAAFGIGVNMAFPSITAPFGAYALVGMAAFFSGTSRATLTSILILFEMTSTYEIILPLMFACVVADAVSRVMSKDTIYTMKIRRKGVVYSYDREVNILETIMVKEVMIRKVACVTENMTLSQVSDKILATGYQGFPCLDKDGNLRGIVTHGDVKKAILSGMDKATPLREVETHDHLIVAYPDETLENAMEKMAEHGFGHLPVVDREHPRRLVGFLTREDIIRVHRKKLEERRDKV